MANHPDWHIIIVEDTFDDRQVLARMLEFHDVQVSTAANGEECLALMQQHMPTAVVTDLAMPNMDGWQTLKAIRADSAFDSVPVIAVTAYHSTEVAEAAVERNFDGYCPKPLDPAHFISSLETIIGG